MAHDLRFEPDDGLEALVAGALASGPGAQETGDDLAPAGSPRLGTGAVTVVEFADFQCPGCQVFSLQGKARLMPFIERGQAQLVYYDFPLGGAHVHSFLAARAARCAGDQQIDGQTAYWTMHDKLYQEQPSWSPMRDVVDTFVGYAEEVGLDRRAFERCLRSDRFADVVTANRLLGERLGVRSTPTVLINNRQMEARTIQGMIDQLMGVLREVVPEAADSTP